MLNKIYTSLLSLAIMASFSSCDKIGENERYIDAKIPDVGRKVLVEEFTGQFCVNCPSGHAMLSNIKNVYGDKVITVSIHAGSLASDVAGYGLKTPEGDTYANAFKVDAYPSIVVDHKGEVISNIAQWQDAVLKCMGQNTSVDLQLSAKTNEDCSISIMANVMSNIDQSVKCQIWVTENDITTFQMEMSGQANADYVHNHVYRASVNGIGGEDLTLKSGEYTNINHSIPVNKSWNVNNLNIVAFVYNSNGVIQVEECKVND